MDPSIGILLAAGQGKRMRSVKPKVVHELFGKPIIVWAIESLLFAGIQRIIVIVSPSSQDIVKETIANFSLPTHAQIEYAVQESPLGTGRAAQVGIDYIQQQQQSLIENSNNIKDFDPTILITYGDIPAVNGNTFKNLILYHVKQNNSFTVLAFETENPFGYGRVLTDSSHQFLAICEEKDCSPEQKKITLCNSGILCSKYKDIIKILPTLKNENSSSEYYLTDVPSTAKKLGYPVGLMLGLQEELLGVNSQEELLKLEEKIKLKSENFKTYS